MTNESSGFFSVFSDRVSFIDPYPSDDVHQPSWDGEFVEPLTHPDLAIEGLVKFLNPEEEEKQIRLSIHEIDAKQNYRQAGNPLNPIRLAAMRTRLTELVTPSVARHQASRAADRVQKPGTNLPDPNLDQEEIPWAIKT